MKIKSHWQIGLTLLEVCCVVGLLAIIAVLIFPAFARPRSGGRTSCTSNLKQIGISYRLYAEDHGGRFPNAFSNYLGGTLTFRDSPVVSHYESMSNELVSTKLLVCPVDSRSGKKRSAADFLGPLSNDNVSYFVGLDAQESKPSTILSGDRNIVGATASNGFLRWFKPDAPAGWTSDIHKNAGNIGLADGSVLQTTNLSLCRVMQSSPLPIIRLAIP